MSKEQTPIGIVIKDIVATVLKIIIGEPAKQIDTNSQTSRQTSFRNHP